MRLIRVRFSVRMMMVGVAVVGVVLGGWAVIERRRQDFRRLSSAHIDRVIGLGVGFGPPSGLGLLSWGPGGRSLTKRERLADEWNLKMHFKYERAAHYPWLPVAPDPPLPK